MRKEIKHTFVITKGMEEARARLLAYKDSIQPYPWLPPLLEEPEPPHPTEGKQWYEMKQLKGQVVHLQNKLNEHIDKKQKDTYEFNP